MLRRSWQVVKASWLFMFGDARKELVTVPELSCDYSLARPSPAAIKAAGYAGVWRYLSGGGNPKDLTKTEANTLHAAGLGIGLIWETTATRALSGSAAGAADGAAAVAQAKALGLPAGCPLVANLGDFKASAGQIPAIQAYYHEFRRVPGFAYEPGGYATGFIISELVKAGAQGLWWQNAMDDAGTPGSVVVASASLYQRVTPTLKIAGSPAGSWDEDVTVKTGAVHWWLPAAPPPPPPGLPAWAVAAEADLAAAAQLLGGVAAAIAANAK